MFPLIPIIDTIPYWIDIRVITSSFKAEKTLTKDTVPVDVDAYGQLGLLVLEALWIGGHPAVRLPPGPCYPRLCGTAPHSRESCAPP